MSWIVVKRGPRRYKEVEGSPACKQAPKTKFSATDDEALTQLVTRLGRTNWQKIAERMPERTPPFTQRQCKERFTHYLDPQVRPGEFTYPEECYFVYLWNRYGPRWKLIAAHFPGKTDIQVKNLCNRLQRKYTFPIQVVFPTPAVRPPATARQAPVSAPPGSTNVQELPDFLWESDGSDTRSLEDWSTIDD
jgi:hypothetical protein